MRFAKLASLAFVAALPLGSQQPNPLTVSLDYTGVGSPAFVTNKPAYVAIFDLTLAGLHQLYPQTDIQRLETRGRSTSSNLAYLNAAALPAAFSFLPSYGMGFAPYFYGYSSWSALGGYGIPWGIGSSSFGGGFSTGWHTVLVVASTSPLRISSPYGSDYRVRLELERRGRYRNFDTEQGIAALLSVIKSPDATAEQVSTFEDYPVSAAQYVAIAPGYRFGSNQMTTCVNDWVNAWEMAPYMWNLNLGDCIPSPQNQSTSPTVPGQPPTDTSIKKIDTTSQGIRGSAFKDGKISDPAEIRRVLESLSGSRAGTGATRSAATQTGGAATTTRHEDPSRRAQVGSGAAGTNGATGSARTKGPIENGTTRATPVPSTPRLTAPPTPPPTPPSSKIVPTDGASKKP